MKKLFQLTIAFFLLTFSLQAQVNRYHAFPDTNAIWRVDHQSSSNCSVQPPNYNTLFEQYQYTLGGDTIIGIYTYKKVYKSGDHGICSGHSYYFYGYEGALRQDTINKKVYFKYPVSNDTLLYDFSLQVGDTVNIVSAGGVNYYSKINTIDSILVGNNYRKRFNITHSPSSAASVGFIIEGIGASTGLLEADNMAYAFEDNWSLICFNNDSDSYKTNINAPCNLIINTVGITKFLNENHIIIYPNPANSNVYIDLQQIEVINTQIEITNLFGDIVKKITINNSSLIVDIANLEAGIYNICITNNVNATNKKLLVVK